MVCLSRLRDFHIVSWKERMDDPIVEWGQLLAYREQILDREQSSGAADGRLVEHLGF